MDLGVELTWGDLHENRGGEGLFQQHSEKEKKFEEKQEIEEVAYYKT